MLEHLRAERLCSKIEGFHARRRIVKHSICNLPCFRSLLPLL